MTRKRKEARPCPLCGSQAHLFEFHRSARNESRFTVLCNDPWCRLSETPSWSLCDKDEDKAVDAWNGMCR